jgi:tRNA threonylcarbamoyladenosine biosynthesis protein TsaE
MIIKSLNDLKKFLKSFAKQISGNEIILLKGGLGLGKTTFVKELLKILHPKLNLNITSPTFTILNLYEAEHKKIYHYDLYRIKSPAELYEIGFFDNLGEDLIFIEWPDLIIDYLKKSKLKFITIELKFVGEAREVLINGT